MTHLARARRLRETPFTERVEAAGVSAYSVYNRMLLPAAFNSVEEDYHHLKSAVQLWDVSCERQVEIRGPDAGRLAQILTPRDLRQIPIGRCAYIPVVDETGGMLNDPVLLKLSEDRYWISIADSDLLYWVKGLAYGLRLEVTVTEPDVAPLAVQGPKADDVVAEVFGNHIRDLRFFGFRPVTFEGVEMQIARSGYSRQGGFEIYCTDSHLGLPLWDALMEAGAPHGIRAGCPNLIERIEGGLLSYGNDMTNRNTPYECGLDRFCDTKAAIACVGRDALLRAHYDGPARQIRSLEVGGDPVPQCSRPWCLFAGDTPAGAVTSIAWSPDFGVNVAIGMIERDFWSPGTELSVACPDGPRPAILRDGPFI